MLLNGHGSTGLATKPPFLEGQHGHTNVPLLTYSPTWIPTVAMPRPLRAGPTNMPIIAVMPTQGVSRGELAAFYNERDRRGERRSEDGAQPAP